ncbi:hypothetical protein [uncultured Shewanella sp.]|uniref:hypothetical protein n=1 Tax=uncultured Shewanella sp. TaxID=173975 RepID=UPI00262E4C71|nr:hypothetical protein [uncultured Shewanella sp.]
MSPNKRLTFIYPTGWFFRTILIGRFGDKSDRLGVLDRLFGRFAVPRLCFCALSGLFTIT